MGLNRTSWKLESAASALVSCLALPMGLNRTSWKRCKRTPRPALLSLPMGLNRTSWKPTATATTNNLIEDPYRWA